jgi:hygromycin-B 7''-O-kinase
MARARHALGAAGLDATVALVRASSVTNEVWLTEDHAIRVNRHPNGRLMREATLGPQLPATVNYPEVVGYGTGAGFDWLIAARRPGAVLSRCWPTMPPAQRRLAVRQLAFMLKDLHQMPCPGGLSSVEPAPQLLTSEHGKAPIAPLLDALSQAGALAHVDSALITALTTFVKAGARVLEPFDAPTLVHGDLTFENVLWDGEQVTAIIDFEWARAAPADIDLDVLLRFCAYPFLHVADDYEAMTRAADYEEVPWWFSEDYPELFAFSHQLDRMRLFAISYDVRELLLSPPIVPMRELSEHHALRRLARTSSGRSYLDTFAAATRQPPS